MERKKIKGFILICCLLSAISGVYAQDSLRLFSIAPLFEARDAGNKLISLQALLKKGPVVLIFYRGQWCPYCNKQMSDLQDSLPFIISSGASLIAITPEKNTEIQKSIAKSGATFSIIWDEGHKIMDAYNVTFHSPGLNNALHLMGGININKASGNTDRVLPVPATYIIASNGCIIGRHYDLDFTKRMSVDAILRILKP